MKGGVDWINPGREGEVARGWLRGWMDSGRFSRFFSAWFSVRTLIFWFCFFAMRFQQPSHSHSSMEIMAWSEYPVSLFLGDAQTPIAPLTLSALAWRKIP